MSKRQEKIAGTREMIELLNNEYGYKMKEGKEIVNQFFSAIGTLLQKYDAVYFKSYLKIDKKFMPKRKGRNPRTGEECIIPERLKLTYKTGKYFKDMIREGYIS